MQTQQVIMHNLIMLIQKKTKIKRELPADTVAQTVERLCDKQKAWVRILASVRFFICPSAFILLDYPGEALEGPILTGVSII